MESKHSNLVMAAVADLQATRIPKRFWELTISGFPDPEHEGKNNLNSYLTHLPDHDCLFIGPSSSGKTFFLSFALLFHLYVKKQSVLYLRPQDLVRWYFGEEIFETYPNFGDAMTEYDVIAVDNLDEGKPNEGVSLAINQMLVLRKDEGKRTYFASSLSRKGCLLDSVARSIYGGDLVDHFNLRCEVYPCKPIEA